ncbi:MAG: hypothetical protein CL862_00925 [Cyanobium sp. NAT70]|nr:hypothetical protein [Cyanobium sp. NAT70]
MSIQLYSKELPKGAGEFNVGSGSGFGLERVWLLELFFRTDNSVLKKSKNLGASRRLGIGG